MNRLRRPAPFCTFARSPCAPVPPAAVAAAGASFFCTAAPAAPAAAGVGGLFFDDWTEGGFAQSFALIQAVGDSFLPAYLPIVDRRRQTAFGEDQRHWQLIRRGRYVEFNLVWDRGTLFGLQSGGRTESILMSMPPEVRWRYDVKPEAGSAEADLLQNYLRPRNWLDL